jgi:hypothetical protein
MNRKILYTACLLVLFVAGSCKKETADTYDQRHVTLNGENIDVQVTRAFVVKSYSMLCDNNNKIPMGIIYAIEFMIADRPCQIYLLQGNWSVNVKTGHYNSDSAAQKSPFSSFMLYRFPGISMGLRASLLQCENGYMSINFDAWSYNNTRYNIKGHLYNVPYVEDEQVRMDKRCLQQ